jgi:CubicO group peptidase (beta-lactamase class C family)
MPPGSKWQYSGGGYTIAQLLVEEVTGRKFDDYMKEEVFRPLGMTSSSYIWDAMVDARAAQPYGVVSPVPGPRFIEQAAASLETSLDDFSRFALASMSSERPELRTRVLSAETVRAMQQPVPPSPNYGLGYQVIDAGGLRAVGHGGSNTGWQAQFLVVPKTGDGLLVMTNATLGAEVHRQLFCGGARPRWAGHALPQEHRGCNRIGRRASRFREAVATWRRLKAERPNDYQFGAPQLNILAISCWRRIGRTTRWPCSSSMPKRTPILPVPMRR